MVQKQCKTETADIREHFVLGFEVIDLTAVCQSRVGQTASTISGVADHIQPSGAVTGLVDFDTDGFEQGEE